MSSGRFQSPFIFKMRFYSPTAKNKGRNGAHLTYIGTRPGVVKDNEVSLDEGDTVLDPDSAAAHVKYAHERPGSHGLFTQEQQLPNLQIVKQELENHEGVVWRMILSLKEEDAQRLSMTQREHWEDKLRASMPDVAAKMGVAQSNLKWVAAFHAEQGHPHVHVVMWEKDPVRKKGLLSQGERRDVKRVFMREIYAGERAVLSAEKTLERDLIRDFAAGRVEEAVNFRKELHIYEKEVSLQLKAAGEVASGISPHMPKKIDRVLTEKLEKLADRLPGRGRLALKFMPEEVKKEAREIADWFLEQPGIKAHQRKYLNTHEQLTKHHTHNPDLIAQARNKAYEDLRDRVANTILRGAGQINRENRQEEMGSKLARTNHSNMTKGIWDSVWKVVERERIATEAKTELERRRSELQEQRQKRIQSRKKQNEKEE